MLRFQKRVTPVSLLLLLLLTCALTAATTQSASAVEAGATLRPDTNNTFESLLGLSLTLYQAGQFEKCIDASRKALKLKPDSDTAYNNICAAHNAMKQWKKGIAACERAIGLNPANQLARNNLAWARSEQAKGPGSEPIRKERKAAPSPDNSDALLELSLSHYQAGRFEKSIEIAEQLLQVKPDSDKAYNNICAAYNSMEQFDEGIKACEKALELNPHHQLAKNNLAWARSRKDGVPLSDMWSDFLKVDYRTPHTINFIDPPKLLETSFMTPLYLLIPLLTVGIFLGFKPRVRGNVPKSFLIASVIAGVLFAARMDYTWFMWLKNDASALSHLDPAGRFKILEADNVSGFAEELKTLVPHDGGVRLFAGDDDGGRNNINGRYKEGREFLTESYRRAKIKYHLLPLKLSERGKYIAVFRDRRVLFDPLDGSLRDNGNLIADGVSHVKSFGNDTYLYKIESEKVR